MSLHRQPQCIHFLNPECTVTTECILNVFQEDWSLFWIHVVKYTMTAVVPVYVRAVVVVNHINGVCRTLFSNSLKCIISGKEESVRERGREGGSEGRGREKGGEKGERGKGRMYDSTWKKRRGNVSMSVCPPYTPLCQALQTCSLEIPSQLQWLPLHTYISRSLYCCNMTLNRASFLFHCIAYQQFPAL